MLFYPQDDKELAAILSRALLEMGQPDREIFLRHYYYCESVSLITKESLIEGAPISDITAVMKYGTEISYTDHGWAQILDLSQLDQIRINDDVSIPVN